MRLIISILLCAVGAFGQGLMGSRRVLLRGGGGPTYTPVATDDFSSYGAPCRLASCGSANWDVVNGETGFAARTEVSPYNVDFDGGFTTVTGMMHWKGTGSFTADQYAVLKIARIDTTTDWIGVSLRVTPASNSGYWAMVGNNGDLRVGATTDSSTRGEFADAWPVTGVTFSTNDLIRFSIVGTSLKVERSTDGGGSYNSVYTHTDSSLSTGQPGLAGYGSPSVSSAGQNWVGGNVS